MEPQGRGDVRRDNLLTTAVGQLRRAHHRHGPCRTIATDLATPRVAQLQPAGQGQQWRNFSAQARDLSHWLTLCLSRARSRMRFALATVARPATLASAGGFGDLLDHCFQKLHERGPGGAMPWMVAFRLSRAPPSLWCSRPFRLPFSNCASCSVSNFYARAFAFRTMKLLLVPAVTHARSSETLLENKTSNQRSCIHAHCHTHTHIGTRAVMRCKRTLSHTHTRTLSHTHTHSWSNIAVIDVL